MKALIILAALVVAYFFLVFAPEALIYGLAGIGASYAINSFVRGLARDIRNDAKRGL